MRRPLIARADTPLGGPAMAGLRLASTPSARQLALRRRLAVVACALGLGLAAGVLGLFAPSHGPATPAAATGPFSYFPT